MNEMVSLFNTLLLSREQSMEILEVGLSDPLIEACARDMVDLCNKHLEAIRPLYYGFRAPLEVQP